jgi:hypothetical protein
LKEKFKRQTEHKRNSFLKEREGALNQVENENINVKKTTSKLNPKEQQSKVTISFYFRFDKCVDTA